VGSYLNQLHLAMKPFCNPIRLSKSPRSDNQAILAKIVEMSTDPSNSRPERSEHAGNVKKDQEADTCKEYKHPIKTVGKTLPSSVEGGFFEPHGSQETPQIETDKIIDKPKNTTALDALLKHIVHGEQDSTEFIIEADPTILFKYGNVVDYSGRLIRGTPYQIAIGAGDHDMAKMISSFFDNLTKVDGQKEKQEQYNEQFPVNNGGMNSSYSYTALIKSISESKSDEECEDSLAIFRDNFEPVKEIRSGSHFNPQLLTDVLEQYIKCYDDFGGYNSRKNNLFWRQVVGYIQRFLPAHFAQAFCQGLNNVAKKGAKLNRSLKFSNGAVYFPLESDTRGIARDPCL